MTAPLILASPWPALVWLVVALCGVAAFYGLVAALTMPRLGSAALVREAASRARSARPQPVSVLKPLCGA
ncbi:MAG: glycosyl transferase, partial [Paraburkholderia sp.]|nr:glycosyl transferase [Paraburkholderia sp.]